MKLSTKPPCSFLHNFVSSTILSLLTGSLLLSSSWAAAQNVNRVRVVEVSPQRAPQDQAASYISDRNNAIASITAPAVPLVEPTEVSDPNARMRRPQISQEPLSDKFPKLGLPYFPSTYQDWVSNYALKHTEKFCPSNSCSSQAVLTIEEDKIKEELVLKSQIAVLYPFAQLGELSKDTDKQKLQSLEIFTVLDNKNQEVPFRSIELLNEKKERVNFTLQKSTPNNSTPSLFLSPGNYELILRYSLKEAQLIRAPQKLAIFINHSGLPSYYRRSDNFIKLNANDTAAPEENPGAPKIEVYRLLSYNKPTHLTTRIQISYGGPAQEVELGAIVPTNFDIMGYSSSVPLRQQDNTGESKGSVPIRAYLTPGRHTINIEAQSAKPLSQIQVANLIDTGQNKGERSEIWSVAPSQMGQPQIELFDAKKEPLPSIDAAAAYVPAEWRGYSAYAVKDSVAVQTVGSSEAPEKPDVLNARVQRNTWVGFGDIIHKDRLQLQSERGGNIVFKPSVDIETISQNNQPLLISQSEKNKEKTTVVYPGENEYSLIATTNKDIPLNFLNNTQNSIVDSWALHLAPRQRVVAYQGADKISGSWVDNWNLYSVFGLFLITLSFYKLFGWRVATLAFVSIILNAQNTFFAWSVWPLILILMALIKVLRPHNPTIVAPTLSSVPQPLENTLPIQPSEPVVSSEAPVLQSKKTGALFILTKSALVALLVGCVIGSASFTLQEVREIINPSLEQDLYNEVGIASAPAPRLQSVAGNNPSAEYDRAVMKKQYSPEIAVPAAAPVSPSPIDIAQLQDKSNYNRNQVSSGEPTWQAQNLYVQVSQHNNNETLSLYIAPVALVALAGIVQILFFWTVCYFLFTFIYLNGLTPSVYNEKIRPYIKNYWKVGAP